MREIKIHTGYTVKDTGCCIEHTIEEVLIHYTEEKAKVVAAFWGTEML